jgi:hypothetical protein
VLARLPGLPHSLESVRVQVLPSPSTSNTIVLPSCPTEISAHTCRSEEDDGSSVVPPEEEVGRFVVAEA